jgi:transaldolase
MTPSVENLKIQLFADGADLDGMLEMNSKNYIKGLTTNPTLMRKAGITNYKSFATEVLSQIVEKPISFEVFSDDLEDMKRQALEIASWGENVYVKIPITNTLGNTTTSVIEYLVCREVKVNVTALMTSEQVELVAQVINPSVPSYISIFAGRIADTGRDPVPTIMTSLKILSPLKETQLIWASPRELLNIFQADEIGCHIITATNDLLKKLDLVGKNLDEYSLETVKMFYKDGKESGFSLTTDEFED